MGGNCWQSSDSRKQNGPLKEMTRIPHMTAILIATITKAMWTMMAAETTMTLELSFEWSYDSSTKFLPRGWSSFIGASFFNSKELGWSVRGWNSLFDVKENEDDFKRRWCDEI